MIAAALPLSPRRLVKFFCAGVPAPKGSAKAFFIRKLNRAIVTNDNARTKPWQQALATEAANARGEVAPKSSAIAVRVMFRFPRPKGHHRANGELKPSAPPRHLVKPDTDKLGRTLLDALTGVLFVDDSQVCDLLCFKRYVEGAELPGADVVVEVLP